MLAKSIVKRVAGTVTRSHHYAEPAQAIGRLPRSVTDVWPLKSGTVYHEIEEDGMAATVTPEELPPGFQGPLSTRRNRAASGVLKEPAYGLVPSRKILSETATLPPSWATGNAWLSTIAGVRRFSTSAVSHKADGLEGLARWEHAPLEGVALGGVGLPTADVPPADLHARDPEDTVYGELNEPLRLADPLPGGPAAEAVLEHTRGGWQQHARDAVAFGAVSSMAPHNAELGPSRAHPQAWAPPVEMQTIEGAAAAANSFTGDTGTTGYALTPVAAGPATAQSRGGGLGQASPTAATSSGVAGAEPWAHEVDTDMEFGA